MGDANQNHTSWGKQVEVDAGVRDIHAEAILDDTGPSDCVELGEDWGSRVS